MDIMTTFAVFGLCSALYAVSRLLLHYSSANEFKGKPATSLQRVACITGLILGYFALPAYLVYTFINRLSSDRMRKEVEKECRNKWHDMFFYHPCPHCGHSRLTRPQGDFEPFDTLDDDI